MSSELKVIGAQDLGAILRRGMGLIVGPSYTAPGFLAALDKALRQNFSTGMENGEPYYKAVDRILNEAQFDDSDAIRNTVTESIRTAASTSPAKQACQRLAGFPWSAVISLGVETAFDDAFKQANTRSPVSRPVMTLDHVGPDVPPRSIPVYHLLGAATAESFVVDSADYRTRQGYWEAILRDFVDKVQADPILCVGLQESGEVLLDLVARLVHTRGFGRAKFVILEEEREVLTNAFRRHLPGGSSLLLFDAHVSDALRAAHAARKAGFTGHLPYDQPTGDFAALAPFSDLAAVVNEQLRPVLRRSDRHQLQDILFSPNTTRWDPFAHELDLRRSAESEVLDGIKTEPNYFASDLCVAGVLRGAAASGKSTLLKRVAFELVREGRLVLWLKPWKFPDGSAELRRLFGVVKGLAHKGDRVVVCLDDPISLYGIEARDIYYAASAAGVRSLILTAVRASDWDAEEDKARYTGGARTVVDCIIPEELDDDEWGRMPGFVVGLNVAADETGAARLLSQANAQNPRRDALATMYLLLEGAREPIKESVKQEYFRLGRAAFGNVVRQLAASASDVLQRMYGLVAASERAGVPVPTEVLVSAAGCNYDDWIEVVGSATDAWGILYEQLDEHGEVLGYRCRNSIVADLVAGILNASTLERGGEYRALRDLLAACDGSGPVYRSYCIRMLVNNPRLDRLSDDEVIALFDAALGSLGPDTTLVHHKAIRLRKARRPKESIALLEEALASEPEPYAFRHEQAEHLHTSYTAALIDLHAQGGISDEEALERATFHLDRARSETFHNARAVHVQARLAIRLGSSAGAVGDRFQLLSRALADVERYLLYYSAPIDRGGLEPTDAEMLNQVREQMLTDVLPDVEALKNEAEEIWSERQGQEGFALCARRLLADASHRVKGSLFKEVDGYCRDKIQRVRDAGQLPDRGLLEVALCGYFRWRVRNQGREGYSGFTSGINWEYIHDLAAALVGNTDTAYPTFRYMLGVAKAHLNDWSGADEIFAQIKRSRVRLNVLWAKRDVLRDANGGHRQVQGEVTTGPRRYLRVEGLDTDVPLNERDAWPGSGGITPAYIVFSFGGYRAVLEQPV